MQVKENNAKKLNISENCLKVLEKRYLKKDKNGKIIETPEEMFRRVASGIAEADKLYGSTDIEIKLTEENFYSMMTNFEFMPNSPTLMNAGKELGQLSACFVLPVGDSMDSIFDAIKNTALIHKSGGGTGFSFSSLRPKNSVVRSTGGVSSGPVSFMKVFNAATQAVKQGGTRRGANMGILRVDHPDILEFIQCKENDKDITNFNISIAIKEDFMEKVIKDKEYSLIDPHTKKVTGMLKAKDVFELIVEMAWKNGEPGVVFIDRINKYNPTPKLGDIESTNPCVTGDTLVCTEHGLMRMRDIVKSFAQGGVRIGTDDRVQEILYSKKEHGGLLVKADPKTGITFNSISKAFFTGHKDVFRLVTKSGYELQATADHKIMTQEGWVKLTALKKNYHRVLMQSSEGKFNEDKSLPFPVINDFIGENGRRYKFGLPSSWSKELGQVLGWIVGDGWLREGDKNCRLGLTFSRGDKEILNYLKPILNNWYGYDIKEVERENGVFHLSYHSRYFVEFFRMLGVKTGQSDEKTVPELIYTASKEAVIGFLQGLFSADGTVNFKVNHSSYVRLTAKSLRLLKGVQSLLLNLGIKSRIYDRSRKERYGFDYVTKNGKIKKYLLDGICYELEISRESVIKFFASIGFLCDKHKGKVDKFYAKKYYSARFEEKIESIEKIGKEAVYDLTESKTYTFITNGFVSLDCGEQPLLPYESCNLGSINLSKVVSGNGKKDIDWDKLKRIVHLGVHFLDNVIDMNKFPLDEIRDMTRRNRKIGLGVMGWADMLIQLEILYNSDEAVEIAEKIMGFIDSEAKVKSEELAMTRGAFPSYNESVFTEDSSRPRRNATLTTIAPTGTISIISNVSSGIEPLFAISYYRNVMDNDKLIEVNPLFEEIAKREGFYSRNMMEEIAEKGSLKDIKEVPEKYKKIFVTSHDIAPLWHIRMQAAFQNHTDNAVSKTVNFPHDAGKEDVKEVYMLAYKLGCKGVTIYRDGSREEQVLNISNSKKNDLKTEDPVRDKKHVAPRPRPVVTTGTTSKVTTGCGNLYVTINVDDNNMPFEVFVQMGKSGGCAASQLEAVARLVSLALRSGVENKKIIDQLKGIRCPSPSWGKSGRIFSCADAVARVLELRLGNGQMHHKEEDLEHRSPHTMIEDKLANVVGVCPDCGAALRHEEGCVVCRSCGYSKC